MEYIVTFDDGSSAYLAHHGVKGMHWGQRNAETQAKYAGGKNGQRQYRLATHGDKYSQSVTNTRRAYNAKQNRAKQVAKVALMGPGGAMAYNTSRSRGLSRADSLQNAGLGVIYTQGVKSKQRKAGTTKTKISESARLRSEYSNKQSTGKQIAKIALGGTVGSIGYDTARSRGITRSGAVAATAVLGGSGMQALGYAASANKGKSSSKSSTKTSSPKTSSPKKSSSTLKKYAYVYTHAPAAGMKALKRSGVKNTTKRMFGVKE